LEELNFPIPFPLWEYLCSLISRS